jgi:hypothetical protein
MKNILRNFILAPAVLCASAAFAANTSTLNVPFSFTAHGKSYPAGQYTVSVDPSSRIATLSSQTKFPNIMGSLVPSDGNPSNPSNARLEFSANGASHELRRIRYGALSTPVIAASYRKAATEAGGPGGGTGGR